jgi:hypothetical protein
MNKLILPEFDCNKRIDSHSALVFSGPSQYDVILGRDFLRKIRMELDFENNSMNWMDNMVLMKDITFWNEASTMSEILMNEDNFRC